MNSWYRRKVNKTPFELVDYLLSPLRYIKLKLSLLSVETESLPILLGPIKVVGINGRVSLGNKVIFRSGTINFDDPEKMGELSIGSNSRINDNVTLAPRGGEIILGQNTFLGPNVHLQSYAGGKIQFGKNVLMAKDSSIFASTHNMNPNEAFKGESPFNVSIGDNVWIGTKVSIVGDLTIGSNCIVAAGSVVTKSIPDNSMAAGAPARVIKRFDHSQNAWVDPE